MRKRYLLAAVLLVAGGALIAVAAIRSGESTADENLPGVAPPPQPDLAAPENATPGYRGPGARLLAQPLKSSLLAQGQDALRRGWSATAYRRCSDAAGEKGPDLRDALLCQARATLRMNWPQHASFVATRALAIKEDVDGLLLLGQAHVAQGNCREARRVFLRAVELEPGNTEAQAGLKPCTVDQAADMGSATTTRGKPFLLVIR